MTEATLTAPTVDSITAAADETFQALEAIIDTLPASLPDGAYNGGWTMRQILSHIVGSYQRMPIYLGIYRAPSDDFVPVVTHDPFWISAWGTAPVESFRAALAVTYTGIKSLVAGLSSDDLAVIRTVPFGRVRLGDFLMINLVDHVANHLQQLEAFTTSS